MTKNRLIVTKNNNIWHKNHLIVDRTELDDNHKIVNKSRQVLTRLG